MIALSPPFSPTALQIAIFVLVSVSMGGILLALRPGRSTGAQLEGRIESVAGKRQSEPRGSPASEESRRRRKLEDTLREMDAEQSARARKRSKPTLHGRIRQAGLSWSRETYLVACAISGVGAGLIALIGFRLGLLPALGFGLAGGLLLPHLYVTRKRSRRLKRFGQEFPNALDVIVRGVKAGLPLVDCLKIIATESQEPVSSEFSALVHDQTVGVPVGEAVERLAERVPLSEASFFAIVLAIQSRTGGNLSEALGNLSKVLRERKNLAGKIKSMSAEAKASAGIIGSMPVAVGTMLYFTSPDYIALLFTTSTGNIALVASGMWMLIGTLVMRKMINFDF